MRRNELFEDLIAPEITGLGFVFEGLEFLPSIKHSTLRVFISKETGISLEDCQKVSRYVGALLEVENLITGKYNLEISSPGLDRLLFTKEHFDAQLGKLLNISLTVPNKGRKVLKGTLQMVMGDEQITLKVDEELITLSLVDIDQARVVPVW